MADLVKKVELKVVANTADAQAKLDAITLEADKLREKNPELKVKIDSFEASAKLAVLRDEIRAAGKDPVDIKVKLNERSVIETKAKLSLLKRFMEGSALGGSGNSKGFLSGLDNLPYGGLGGLVAALPVVGALLVEVTGLAAGLTAAAAGAGAFGLLALPTFKRVQTAYTNLSAAQTKYNQAEALYKESPTKTNANAAAKALLQLQVVQESMGPSTRKAVNAIHELIGSFDKIAKTFQPTVLKVFNDGLSIANHLLPTLKAPAQAFGNALDGLLKQFDKFTQSKGFQDWLAKFDKLIGPATTAIGHGIGEVVTQFGKLITTLSSKDVVNSINIAFRVLGGTIHLIQFLVERLTHNWTEMVGAFVQGWHNIRQWTLNTWHAIDQVFHNIAHAYDNVKHAIGVFVGAARADYALAVQDVKNWVNGVIKLGTGVINWFKALPGRILAGLGNLGSLLWNAGASIINGFLGGLKSAWSRVTSFIGSIGGWIASHKGPIGVDRVLLRPHGQAIMDGLVGGMNDRMPNLAAAVGRATSIVQATAGHGRGGTGHAELVLRFQPTGNAVIDAIGNGLRGYIQRRGGAGPTSVQRALGQTS